jgi:hypothetical protein
MAAIDNAEIVIRNDGVGGSSPSCGTKITNKINTSEKLATSILNC